MACSRNNGWPEAVGNIVAWVCVVIVVIVVIVGCLALMPGCNELVLVKIEAGGGCNAGGQASGTQTSQPATLDRTLEYTDRMMGYD